MTCAELGAAGRYKKVSASFYRPDAPCNPKPGAYYLRHVGFLGAQPPAVKSLKAIEFADGEDGDVVTVQFANAPVRGLHAVLHGIRQWMIEKFGFEYADRALPSRAVDMMRDEATPQLAKPPYPAKDDAVNESAREMRTRIEEISFVSVPA